MHTPLRNTMRTSLLFVLLLNLAWLKAQAQEAAPLNPRAPIDISAIVAAQDPGINSVDAIQGIEVRDVNDAGWVYGHYTSPAGGSTRLFVITTDSLYNLDSLIIIDDVQGARAVDMANNGNVVYNRYNPTTGDPEGILRVYTAGVGYGGPERAVKFVDNSWANAVEGQYSAGKVYMFEDRPDFGQNVPLIGWIPVSNYLIFEDYWRGQIKKNNPGFGDTFIDFGTSLAFYYNRWSEVFDVRADGSAAGYTYASEQGPYLNNPVPLVRYFDDEANDYRLGTVLNGEIGEARKINTYGEVAGYWWESQANQTLNGFYSDPGCTNIFGEFKWKDILPDQFVTVRGLNLAPFVVGSYPTEKAYVYKPCNCDEEGRFYDLTTLLVAKYDSLEWKYETAWGLNNANYVVGRAEDQNGREFPYRARIPLCIDCPDLEVVTSFPKTWRSDKPFDFDEYVEEVSNGSDASQIQWFVEDKRTGALNPVPDDQRNAYYFGREGRDEWGRVKLVPGVSGGGGCFDIGGATNGGLLDFGNAVYVEVLDWGLYFLSDGPEMEKFAKDDPDGNPYFDPSKPTMIFAPGWQYAKVGNHNRDNIQDFDGNYLAKKWRDKGYNFAVFYWTQFADDNPILAEFKIYGPSRYGLTWRKERDLPIFYNGADESSPDSSVTTLFLQQYLDFLQENNGEVVRLAGHGYGTQLVANAAKFMLPSERPYRIAFIDPVFTPSLIADPLAIPNYTIDKLEDVAAATNPNIGTTINYFQDILNDLAGEPVLPRDQFKEALTILNDAGLALEWYESSNARRIADIVEQIPNLIDFARAFAGLFIKGGGKSGAGGAGGAASRIGNAASLNTATNTEVAPAFAQPGEPDALLPFDVPYFEELTLEQETQLAIELDATFTDVTQATILNPEAADAQEAVYNYIVNFIKRFKKNPSAQTLTKAAKLAGNILGIYKLIKASVNFIRESNDQFEMQSQVALVQLNILDTPYLPAFSVGEAIVQEEFEQHTAGKIWYFNSIEDKGANQPQMVRYGNGMDAVLNRVDVLGDWNTPLVYRDIYAINAASCDERIRAFMGFNIGQVGGSFTLETSADDLFIFNYWIQSTWFEDVEPATLCCEEGRDIQVANIIEYPQNGDVLVNEPFAFDLNTELYDPNDTKFFVGRPDKAIPNKTRWFEVEDPNDFWFDFQYYEGWNLDNTDSLEVPYGQWKIKAESVCEETTIFQEIEVEVLDWGLYMKGPDGKLQKYVHNRPNDYRNPANNLLIYSHGFQGGAVARRFLGQLNFKGQDMTKAWKDDRWDVAVFNWTQFADGVNVLGAEGRIWETNAEGLRWRRWDNSFSNEAAPTDKAVGNLFAEEVNKISSTVSAVKEIRFLGHSLGSQIVTRGADLVERKPDRVALSDAFFSTGNYQKMYNIIRNLNGSADEQEAIDNDQNWDNFARVGYTAFEWYQATSFDQVGQATGLFKNDSVKRELAFARIAPNWLAEEFELPGLPIDLVSFIGTNYIISPESVHSAPTWWYLNSYGYDPGLGIPELWLEVRPGNGTTEEELIEQGAFKGIDGKYYIVTDEAYNAYSCLEDVQGYRGHISTQIHGKDPDGRKTITPTDDVFKLDLSRMAEIFGTNQ